MKKLLLSTLTVALFGTLAGTVLAENRTGTGSSTHGQAGNQDVNAQGDVFGAQLMTPQELAEHRAQLQSAKTSSDRERVLQQHRTTMQSRAKERGISLPDESPSDLGPGSSNDRGMPR